MKYTQRDKARILRLSTRTLQRWKSTKPELYALIEASFMVKERVEEEDIFNEEMKKIFKNLECKEF